LISYQLPSPPHAHSFPTRRSSDLMLSQSVWLMLASTAMLERSTTRMKGWPGDTRSPSRTWVNCPFRVTDFKTSWPSMGARIAKRSEEHTSELQSRFEFVCRLLLEK